MSIKLYGSTDSTCSIRVLLIAAELGLDVSIVNVDLSKMMNKVSLN